MKQFLILLVISTVLFASCNNRHYYTVKLDDGRVTKALTTYSDYEVGDTVTIEYENIRSANIEGYYTPASNVGARSFKYRVYGTTDTVTCIYFIKRAVIIKEGR